MILLLLIDVLRPLYSNVGIWRTKANGASNNSVESPKTFSFKQFDNCPTNLFFRWILESGGGGGEGVPKIGERFYAGWRGAHEESFKRIQCVSRHIDGSRWTDWVIYSGEISFLCSLYILFVLLYRCAEIHFNSIHQLCLKSRLLTNTTNLQSCNPHSSSFMTTTKFQSCHQHSSC